MGWGGSVQTMINTLKANKALLKRRKKLFEREPQYGKIKRRYTKASEALRNAELPNEEVLSQIRQKLKKDRKREVLIKSLSAFLVTFFTLVLCYSFYRNLTYKQELKHTQSLKTQQDRRLRAYRENMQIGKNQMQNHDYFFAVGSFSQALRSLPNDSLAEYQLAYAYCMLCKTKSKGCDKANEVVDDLIVKHPDANQYHLLKSNYLQKDN